MSQSERKLLAVLVFGALMFVAGALVDSYEVNRKYGVPMLWRAAPSEHWTKRRDQLRNWSLMTIPRVPRASYAANVRPHSVGCSA